MEHHDEAILKSILEKRRNCIALTDKEEKWANEVFGKLLDKKFKKSVFVCKTGDEIRKEKATEDLKKRVNKDIQPDAAISEERSKFGTKDSKIENDDPSGTVKATETGDMVNVDEKRVGGTDDAQTEAQATNAHDIINSNKEDLQRKPVLKAGDIVVKTINTKKYVGSVIKSWPEHSIAQIKWANGTFSNVHHNDIKRLVKAANEQGYEEEDMKVIPPITKPADEKSDSGIPSEQAEEDNKKPATKDVNKASTRDALRNMAGKVTKAKNPFAKPEEPKEENETPEDEANESNDEQFQEALNGTEQHDVQVEENTGEPKAELPETKQTVTAETSTMVAETDPSANVGSAFVEGATGASKSGDASAFAAGAEGAAKAIQTAKDAAVVPVEPSNVGVETYENTWMARCMKSAEGIKGVQKADCLCRLAYGKMTKSNEKAVKLTKEEIRVDNPELAKCMDEEGHESLMVETNEEKEPEVKVTEEVDKNCDTCTKKEEGAK